VPTLSPAAPVPAAFWPVNAVSHTSLGRTVAISWRSRVHATSSDNADSTMLRRSCSWVSTVVTCDSCAASWRSAAVSASARWALSRSLATWLRRPT
jgi:hypothetical protein